MKQLQEPCMRSIKNLALLIFSAALALSAASEGLACTLWGAAGGKTENGGTIIAKNRDWEPTQIQDLKKVLPLEGFRYLGLFATDGGGTGLKAGVNEKGLAVVTATASTIPRSKRSGKDADSISSPEILKSCASVDDVLAMLDRFCNADFYLVADKTKVAVIEVAPGKRAVARVTHNGALAQTNHYQESTLSRMNRKVSASSQVRYERILELLSEEGNGLSLEDFIAFSEDREAGPDNSIWRTGGSPVRTRTLATWILESPANGLPPSLYLKIANPDQPQKTMRLVLDSNFWETRPRGDKAAETGEEKPIA